MQGKNILIIGSPRSYQYIDIDLLNARKIKPFFTYSKDEEPLPGVNTILYSELTIEHMEQLIKQHDFSAIACLNDNFILETARLRDNGNISGLGYEEALKFKSKSRMYDLLRNKVHVPNYLKLNTALKFDDVVNILGEPPFFIKPDTLAGAEGTCHITDSNSFSSWQQVQVDHIDDFIIQPYLDFELYHCELMVENNKVRYIHARKYSFPNHHFLLGKTIMSIPIENKNLKALLESKATDVQQQLEFTSGVMHTEFFVAPENEPIFLETNIRQAGGAINLIHAKRAGISQETAMVLLECGETLPLSLNNHELFICGYIPRKEGRVVEIEVPSLRGRIEYNVRVKLNQIVAKPKSASDASVSFLGQYKSYDDLMDDYRYFRHHDVISYEKVSDSSPSLVEC